MYQEQLNKNTISAISVFEPTVIKSQDSQVHIAKTT